MLQEKEINDLISAIARTLDPEKILLFGSYVKGIATAKSDLDLFIVQATSLPGILRTEPISSMLQHRYMKIDAHILTPEEVEAGAREKFSFVDCVLRTGKVVYEKQR